MLPAGIHFKDHAEELRYLRIRPQRVAMLLLVLALAVFPFFASAYLIGVAITVAVTMIAVAGLQITVGMAGLLNLGQSAFVGVGAFTAAALYANYGVPMLPAIVLAGLASGVVSIVFSLPAIRIKGLYLALTTIAAQVVFPVVVLRLPTSWFGGSAGIGIDQVKLFGIAVETPARFYGVAVAVTFVMLAIAFNLQRSHVGLAFRAIRDNDIASSVLGVQLGRYKITAFFAGAVFAGVAGGLYAFYIRYVTTDQFTIWLSIWYVGMLIVGGLSGPLGAILGTIAVTVLQEAIHWGGNKMMGAMPQVSGGVIFSVTNIVLGAAIIYMLIREPRGLNHRWNVLKAAYRIWPYPRG
ncbi:MAG: branched-chain amino acid ABC transporter permease [Caldimonas sp.]